MACGYCGCKETAVNDARGETVCTSCGRVLSEGAMVDMLTFGSGGRMQGQFIDSRTGTIRGFASLYGPRNNSEVTIARGFGNLERVADRLSISPSVIEASKRLYRLALQRNFTVGRNNYYVVSACLYAVCRKEKAAQMLIDFSDALMVPVKTLAQVFMKLTASLSLQVPCVDPSLFMDRFAHSMDLGPKANKVAQTGVRIVQAMTRDWLVTGRRPLGLCAASLLVSARYHGCKLNSDDINEIFRVSQSTVDKRLLEFKETAVAQISVKDFEQTDVEKLPHAALPPCVLHPSKKRRLMLLDNYDAAYTSSKPVHLLDQEIPQLLDKDTPKGRKALMGESLEGPHAEADKADRSEQWLEAHLQRLAIENSDTSNLGAEIPLSEVTTVEIACSQKLPVVDVAGVAHNFVRAAEKRVDGTQSTVASPSFVSSLGDDAESLINSILAFVPEDQRMNIGEKVGSGPEKVGEGASAGNEEEVVSGEAASQEKSVGDSLGVPAATILAQLGLASSPEGTPSGATTPFDGGGTTALVPAELSLALQQSLVEEDEYVRLGDSAGAEETLSDVEESLVAPFLLSEEEREAKAVLWDDLMKDVMPLVLERARERHAREGKKSGPKRRPPLQSMANPGDSVKAALSRANANINLNEKAVDALFSI